jgi:signal transduction histidine kinase
MALHLVTEETVGPLTPKQWGSAVRGARGLRAAAGDRRRAAQPVAHRIGTIELHTRRTDPAVAVDLAIEPHPRRRRSRRVTIRAEAFAGLPEVFVDHDRMQLVFSNLVTNAIRYRAARQRDRRARARRGRARRRGIAPRPARRRSGSRSPITGPASRRITRRGLFEKFFRVPGSPAGGSGLGLFIARGVVQAHGGAIGVDSEPGRARRSGSRCRSSRRPAEPRGRPLAFDFAPFGGVAPGARGRGGIVGT